MWRRVAAGLVIIPALAKGGTVLAQAAGESLPGATANATDMKEGVRQMIRMGRSALMAGDVSKARAMAQLAQSTGVKLESWEDSPEKLLNDINHLGTTAAPAPTAAAPMTAPAAPPAAPAKAVASDPRELVKQSRLALKAGNLELAKELANKANSSNARWGLFEDSPAKLLGEIQKEQETRNKVEAEKILAQARLLFQKNQLDDAERLAQKADRLHGPYGVLEVGDRPSRLMAEIEAARAKLRLGNVAATGTGTDARATAPVTPAGYAATGHAATADHAIDAHRHKAVGLLREARAMEKAGLYHEARAKAFEAKQLKVEFGPAEDHPDRVVMDVTLKAQRQIDAWLNEATVSGGQNAGIAKQKLDQARRLAMAMGLDTHPIDQRSAQMVRASAPVQPASATATKGPADTGRDMLEKARLELRAGNTDASRRLVVEVLAGPYGLQAEAQSLLRNIDTEEYNQRILAANRAYEAASMAYLNKEYDQALGIFLQIDGTLLSSDKRNRMKDMMQVAGAQPAANVTVAKAPPAAAPEAAAPIAAPPPIPSGNPIRQVGGQPPVPNVPMAPRVIDKPATPMPMPMPTNTAPMTTAPVVQGQPSNPSDFANQVQALQQIEFQRLRADGLKVQRDAQARFGKGETDAAIQMLQDHLAKIKEAQIDPANLALLTRPVEYRLQTFKVLKTQRDAETNLALRSTQHKNKMAQRAIAEDSKKKEIADLMKQYNQLFEEGKYREAEMLAMKAHELDPDDPGLGAAIHIARIQARQSRYQQLKDNKEQLVLDGLNDAEDEGKFLSTNDPLTLNPERTRLAQMRTGGALSIGLKGRSEKEKEIERKLSTQLVTINFKNTPLRQVISDLRVMTRMNIVPALEDLKADSVSLESPVDVQLDAVPLKSALNILLRQNHLTYVIRDDALQITTEKGAKGKLIQKVYSVADLVIPVDNYAIPTAAQLPRALDQARSQVQLQGMSAFSPAMGLSGGVQAGGGLNGASMSTAPGAAGSPSAPANSPMAPSATTTGAKNTMEDTLLKLITSTVAPQSWSDVGGSGTIDYFPIGMALVVNQTADIQEQVAELLEALRKLQDLEVAVEVRVITLAETFFERIGLDFALNVKTDANTSRWEPQITTGHFKPAGFINDFHPKNFFSGLTPAGTLTSDLDVPLRASSFQYAIPPFAYPNIPGSNGGLSLGLAFLSDIQVFMFMEAAQGDRRTNVMQAPKLTLFNGQTSTIQVQDFQFFVTNVTVVSVNGQVVFVPQNQPFPVGQIPIDGSLGAAGVGISMTIQAVVSADRRFVRLNLTPSLSTLASATVPLFPVTTFIVPTFEGGFQGQPIPFTQFIQQPKFSFLNVQTTVSVPDGGTVLMGGLKTLSEGRNEFGPPVLSKIPYVNRLFKNVGYGREAQSMLIMVTPRIIINSEEEERQTGLTNPPPQ
jgi:type II secretory pathway component GspD/PulD (secretin)